MEGSEEIDTTHVEEEIMPRKVEKTPYTWKPKESSVAERINEDFTIAMAKMSTLVGQHCKPRKDKWVFNWLKTQVKRTLHVKCAKKCII
jgi:hypothetical protein